jgi:hypothetical protein
LEDGIESCTTTYLANFLLFFSSFLLSLGEPLLKPGRTPPLASPFAGGRGRRLSKTEGHEASRVLLLLLLLQTLVVVEQLWRRLPF